MRPLIFILAVALTALAGITTWRAQRQHEVAGERLNPLEQDEPLKKLWSIPDFTLTERSGQPFSTASLKGAVWVADFFYASCPGPCRQLTTGMSKLNKALGPNSDVRLVSITTDPESDTPERLRDYANEFGANDHWFFLTGPKSEVDRLANQVFKVGFSENPGAKERITHGTSLLLVDRAGTVRGIYDVLNGDPQHILNDIHRLEKE